MTDMVQELRAVVARHVDAGQVPGLVFGVYRQGELYLDALGTAALNSTAPMTTDAVVRISSMTKPIVAALTLMLVEDGVLSPHEPIDRWVPELADRRVLTRLDAPLDDTVPAWRPITLDDLLTMRMGFGFVFGSPCPTLEQAAAAGLGIGPPDPSCPLTPDEWAASFARLPLLHQPGKDWMYDLAFGVLGVVLTRAAQRPLDVLLDERVLTPLGMTDTGFAVPRRGRARLVPCYAQDGSGGLVVFDGADVSRWDAAPAFPDPRGGLVSTAADYLCFARLLLGRGLHQGARLLSESSVTAMTTDQLGPERAESTSAEVFLSGGGWGFGLEVVTPEQDPTAQTRRYGWGGGLGTTWYSFPDRDVAAVLLTQVFTPPESLVAAFWSALRRMIDA